MLACVHAWFFWGVGWGGTGVWTLGFTCKAIRLYHLSHISSPFRSGYFGDRISRTFSLGWLWNHNPPALALPGS
jgi:hypothetical protein